MTSSPTVPDIPIRRVSKVDWLDPPPPIPHALPVPIINGSLAINGEGKKALFVGGYCVSAARSTNAVAEFDFTTRIWSSGNGTFEKFPYKVSEAGMVSIGTTYFVYGGWDDSNVRGDVHALTMTGPVQPSTTSNTPQQGMSSNTPADATNKNGVAQWRCIYQAPTATKDRSSPSPRRGASVTTGILAGKQVIFVFGGYNGSRRLNDTWAFDIDACEWISIVVSGKVTGNNGVPTCTPAPRDGAALAFEPLQSRLLMFGGYTESIVNDVFELRFENSAGATISHVREEDEEDEEEFGRNGVKHYVRAQWTKLKTLNPPLPRHGCFGLVCGHCFVVGFGADAKGPSKQLFQLNIADLSWTVCNLEGDEIVDARAGAAVGTSADGKRSLIFGGQTYDGRYLYSGLDIEWERAEVIGGKARR